MSAKKWTVVANTSSTESTSEPSGGKKLEANRSNNSSMAEWIPDSMSVPMGGSKAKSSVRSKIKKWKHNTSPSADSNGELIAESPEPVHSNGESMAESAVGPKVKKPKHNTSSSVDSNGKFIAESSAAHGKSTDESMAEPSKNKEAN